MLGGVANCLDTLNHLASYRQLALYYRLWYDSNGRNLTQKQTVCPYLATQSRGAKKKKKERSVGFFCRFNKK